MAMVSLLFFKYGRQLLIYNNNKIIGLPMMSIKQRMYKYKNQSSSQFKISDGFQEEQSYPNDLYCAKQQKKVKQKFRKISALNKKSHGSWSTSEEKKFIEFMKKRRSIFEDKQLRRSHKIFKQMARFMKTRSSEQCRSHHQKYEIKLKSFDNIIAYVEGKIIDNDFPDNLDIDSNYEFLNQANCEWQNNPVYAYKPKNPKNSLELFKGFSLKQKLDIKTQKQQEFNETEENSEVIAKLEGQWKLMRIQPNSFIIKINFDNFQ